MKIAFVIANLNSGGAERAVSNLSVELSKAHDVSVILFDASDIGYPFGGKIIDLNSHPKESKLGKLLNVFSRASKLKKVYKEHNFDAIFAFMEGSGIPSLLVNKDTIVSVRNNIEDLPGLYKPFFPYLYRKAKKVVACSHSIERDLIENYGFKNTTTIHNTVNIELVVDKSKESIEIERPYIFALGRLVPQKGFDFLIEAYSNSQAKEHLDLLICGEGEKRAELQSMIDERGLKDKVTLKGSVNNPFAYYSKTAQFVLSSRHEGFPNILIEALACGSPCISFDCKTGPNEVINNGENGLLVEAENVEKLTEAMDKLSSDKALENQFRENAKASVSHLNPESISQKWVELI